MSGAPRVAVLGTGAISQVVHLPALQQMQELDVQALADVDRPKATAIAGRFGVPRVHGRDADVFEDEEIDAVIVCTPSHLHEEQAIGALEAGKHVLVEKPLALTAAGAERVIRAAERSGRHLLVAMNNRYRPDVQALLPFARGGELGELFFTKAGWLNRKVRVARPTWRQRRETAGGGALMDLGVQVLDLVLWLMDYPKAARIVAHMHQAEGLEVEDSAALMLVLEAGPVISLEVTNNLLGQRDRHYLQFLGTRGTATLSPLAVHKEVEHGLLDVTPALPGGQGGNVFTASYRHQLVEFARVLSGEREAQPPREQVELMRLISLAYRSAAEGTELDA
jgi:predicted dehydrogenase